MTTRRAAWSVVLLVVAVFGVSFGSAPSPATAAPALRLTLVSQEFNIAADGSLRFVVQFPDDLQVDGLPNATLVVTAYRAVNTRAAVIDAQQGTLPRSADTVDLPLAQLQRPAANSVLGLVQLESSTRTPGALQLAVPGLYPITLEVRDGNDVVAELITFVNRLSDAGADDTNPADELRVAVAMRASSSVRLDNFGAVIVDDEVISEMTHLADILDLIAPTGVPATISVPPAWLAALATNGPTELADRLAGGLFNHDLLSAPRLPLDASQAADVGEQALYTSWQRDGDDLLAAAVSKPALRTVTLIDSPLDQGGAALHRDLGSRMLVLPAALYDQLPNSPGVVTDTSHLVAIEVSDGVQIDATIPDRQVSALLTTESASPALTAIFAVADLLATRRELIDLEEIPSRHGITLATPDLSLPPTATLGAVAALIEITPGLQPTTLDEIGVRTSRLTVAGETVLVGLPTTVEGALSTRLAPQAELEDEAAATSSMLPVGDARPADWARLIDLLPTSALTDTQVATMIASLHQQLLDVRNLVGIPPGFRFTLTGRRTTVPIKLHNAGDIPLTVRVHMTSSKLLFPGGDQTVTLPPQAFFNVEIPIEVRSNGRFPVTLEVFTPVGDLHLAPPVPLTARVNAISGLGNLVTGAFLLVVMTWWVRHVRKKRRRRAAQRSSLRHPVNGSETPAGSLPD